MATKSSTGDSKVDDYINIYRPLEVLHPVVAKIYETPELKRMFWNCLTYDLNVINRRSPNLADFEITAAQKAFSALMGNEKDGVAAVEIYVEEILGLKFNEDSDRVQALNTTIQMRNCMLDAAGPRCTLPAPFGASSSELSVSPQNEFDIHGSFSKRPASTDLSRITEGLFVSDGSDGSQVLSSPHGPFGSARNGFIVDNAGDQALKPNEEDPKLNRLLGMFHQAKNDFRVAPLRSIDRTKAAKFLRDTIENTLAYITTKQLAARGKEPTNGFESSTLEDLQETLKQARAVAEEGSGGKKRRFDAPQEATGIGSQPNAQNLRTTDPILRGRATETNAGQSDTYRPSAQRGPPVSSSGQHRNDQARQKRSVSPFHRYPATIGQSVRRVFPRIEKSYTKRKQPNAPRRGDRYRPLYK